MSARACARAHACVHTHWLCTPASQRAKASPRRPASTRVTCESDVSTSSDPISASPTALHRTPYRHRRRLYIGPCIGIADGSTSDPISASPTARLAQVYIRVWYVFVSKVRTVPTTLLDPTSADGFPTVRAWPHLCQSDVMAHARTHATPRRVRARCRRDHVRVQRQPLHADQEVRRTVRLF